MPAALFMVLTRTVIRTVALNRTDPAEVLMRANEILDNDTQSDLFVTAFYAIWNPETQMLAYANGGHNPPLLLGAARPLSLVKRGRHGSGRDSPDRRGKQ
ncbi:MAG: serine/threonine-protein phosphatase [Chloroflexi bacterium]|nr:serine/threonine-protein phosphatase [Chloroflexota bacterium]